MKTTVDTLKRMKAASHILPGGTPQFWQHPVPFPQTLPADLLKLVNRFGGYAVQHFNDAGDGKGTVRFMVRLDDDCWYYGHVNDSTLYVGLDERFQEPNGRAAVAAFLAWRQENMIQQLRERVAKSEGVLRGHLAELAEARK